MTKKLTIYFALPDMDSKDPRIQFLTPELSPSPERAALLPCSIRLLTLLSALDEHFK